MSADEIERGLIAQGVPREKARVIALRAPVDGNPLAKPPKGTIEARGVAFPLALILPWSALVSDNAKYAPAYGKRGQPKMVLRPRYREAKKKTAGLAREIMAGAEPLATPLALSARVWVPDNRVGHDVANFAKCCHDALEKVVYVKDEWLYRITWERAGVDVDRPRAELTIDLFRRALTTSEAAA
jgi:Holliday junction resolvase RusA-like endonuclease